MTTTDNTALDTIANYIQSTVAYIKKRFPKSRDSYNIFFYHYFKHIHAKIFPRYTASPLYMGYRITHVMDSDSKKRMMETLASAKYFGE